MTRLDIVDGYGKEKCRYTKDENEPIFKDGLIHSPHKQSRALRTSLSVLIRGLESRSVFSMPSLMIASEPHVFATTPQPLPPDAFRFLDVDLTGSIDGTARFQSSFKLNSGSGMMWISTK